MHANHDKNDKKWRALSGILGFFALFCVLLKLQLGMLKGGILSSSTKLRTSLVKDLSQATEQEARQDFPMSLP